MRVLLPGRDYFPPRVLVVPAPMKGTTISKGTGIPDPAAAARPATARPGAARPTAARPTAARPAAARPAKVRPPACRSEDIPGKPLEPSPATG